ncbi:MAG: hypothetical protein RSA20_08180 [Oscillospiraceae bacterium]
MRNNKILNRLKTTLEAATAVQLVGVSGAFLIAVFLAVGLWNFGRESVAHFTGGLTTLALTAEDFEQIALSKTEDGKLVSTDTDCQLLFSPQQKMSNVSFTAKYSVHPGEVTMYYTTKEGQGFSATKRYRFFKEPGEENRYSVSFGVKKIQDIRIDPTTAAGNEMEISEIVINAPKTLGSFFAVGYGDIFNLLVYSGIIAACLGFVKEMVIKKTN